MLRQDRHSVQDEQVSPRLLCSHAVQAVPHGHVRVRSKVKRVVPGAFRGIVEETPNTTEHGRPSVMLEKYASATKMQPQSSGSLRSNAGIEKGKEIAARLNVHRIHSQLRGLDSTGQTAAAAPLPVGNRK